MRDAEAFLRETARQTEAALAVYLEWWQGAPERLKEAAAYSLLGQGKRLRPALVLGTSRMLGGEDAAAMPAACAVEIIHCYSLIHDDLPAMDDDELRRGKPTLHCAYDEATAILAGDALLTLAFEVAAQTEDLRVVRELARAGGALGMAGGQMMDLESEGKALSLDELKRVHARKTGALIRASIRAGGLIAGAGDDLLGILTTYGEHVGLAFQIKDDLLDVIGLESVLGKPVGSDAWHEKATYPAIVGVERSQELAVSAMNDALRALEPLGAEADMLRRLARFIVERDH